jgi:hypothetical protein
MLRKNQLVLLMFGLLYISAQASDFKSQAYSLAVQPSYSNTFVQFKSNTYSTRFKDSILDNTQGRTGLNLALMWSFKMRSKTRFQTGLMFQNLGYSVLKDNLHFLDTIHPRIGIMSDLSQTGPSYVDFRYRFFQLALPIAFEKSIFNKKATQISWVYGGAVAIMFKHSIKAVLHGFSARGNQKVFVFDNPEEGAVRMDVQFQTGLKIATDIDAKGLKVFAQPNLILPVFNANTSAVRHHLYQIGIQIGLQYTLQESVKS